MSGPSPTPKQDMREATADLVRIWQAVAASSADIAHAKRTIFLAYVAEGFSEAQALELVKQI